MTAPKLSVDPDILRYFDYEHLPAPLREVSKACADLAHEMVDHLPDVPELRAGLRKLLEAKDSFVRCALDIGTVTTATATKGQACADVDRG
jgi:hypothetical protein